MAELPFDSYVAAILANGILRSHDHTPDGAVKVYADVLQALENAKTKPKV